YRRQGREIGPVIEAGLELEGLESLLRKLCSLLGHDLCTGHVDGETQLDAIAQLAAEELVHRQFQDASSEIVQGDIDPRLRRVAATAEGGVHGDAQLVERQRILADQQRG